MSLPYGNMQDVFLREDNSQLTLKRNYTESLRKLLENDFSLNPDSDSLPDIWKCRWYNGMYQNCGYPKGAAVWINADDIDDFITKRYEEISSFAMKNPMIRQKIKQIDGDHQKETKFFKNLVLGNVSYAPNLEPMYFLGDATKPIQIRVSISANNTALPTDDRYWKDTFDYQIYEKNEERLENLAEERISAALSTHYSDYHLDYSNISDDYRSMAVLNNVVDNSVRCNLSANLDSIDMQMYRSHRDSKLNTKGFDYVLSVRVIKSQSDPKCLKWARLWNSGLLEQGGVIKIRGDLGDSYMSQDGYVQIKLPYRYNYPQSTVKRMYEIRSGFLQTDVLPEDNRYVTMTTMILVDGETPYGEIVTGKTATGDYYYANEVANVKNGSFWLKVANQDAYYSFKTSGFIKNVSIATLVNM